MGVRVPRWAPVVSGDSRKSANGLKAFFSVARRFWKNKPGSRRVFFARWLRRGARSVSRSESEPTLACAKTRSAGARTPVRIRLWSRFAARRRAVDPGIDERFMHACCALSHAARDCHAAVVRRLRTTRPSATLSIRIRYLRVRADGRVYCRRVPARCAKNARKTGTFCRLECTERRRFDPTVADWRLLWRFPPSPMLRMRLRFETFFIKGVVRKRSPRPGRGCDGRFIGVPITRRNGVRLHICRVSTASVAKRCG